MIRSPELWTLFLDIIDVERLVVLNIGLIGISNQKVGKLNRQFVHSWQRFDNLNQRFGKSRKNRKFESLFRKPEPIIRETETVSR